MEKELQLIFLSFILKKKNFPPSRHSEEEKKKTKPQEFVLGMFVPLCPR